MCLARQPVWEAVFFSAPDVSVRVLAASGSIQIVEGAEWVFQQQQQRPQGSELHFMTFITGHSFAVSEVIIPVAL